jgi:hypothetical protein
LFQVLPPRLCGIGRDQSLPADHEAGWGAALFAQLVEVGFGDRMPGAEIRYRKKHGRVRFGFGCGRHPMDLGLGGTFDQWSKPNKDQRWVLTIK